MPYHVFYKSYDKPCFYVITLDASTFDEAREKAINYIRKYVKHPQEAYIVNAKYAKWIKL